MSGAEGQFLRSFSNAVLFRDALSFLCRPTTR